MQFYVATELDLKRCREAQISRLPITITGRTHEGRVQVFTGTVVAVEDDPRRGAQRYRTCRSRNRTAPDPRAVRPGCSFAQRKTQDQVRFASSFAGE
jgi:hypothetical protein